MKRIIPMLFLIPSLSYADLNIQDGQYLITTQGDAYVIGDYSLNVYDPTNSRLMVSVSNGTKIANVYIGSLVAYPQSTAYHSKSGLHYLISLGNHTRPVACTVENADPNNPLATVIKNCTLMGTFSLMKRPYGIPPNVSSSGSWYWAVNAVFDANGMGTFTLTPTNAGTDQYMAEPRPNIGTFQVTYAQFLMMLY